MGAAGGPACQAPASTKDGTPPRRAAGGRDPLLSRVRALWVRLCGTHVTFPPQGRVRVVVSPDSQLTTPSWLGVIVLGGSGIVTVPDERAVEAVTTALPGRPFAQVSDLTRLLEVPLATAVMGPATLSYLDAADYRPARDGHAVEVLPAGGAELAGLLAGARWIEVERSGLGRITSEAFVVRDRDAVVAAAGYRVWTGAVAHMSVMTATGHRNRGLGRSVAAAATAHALSHQLLPQWRAEPEPSRRVAAAVGFRRLGVQFGVCLATR